MNTSSVASALLAARVVALRLGAFPIVMTALFVAAAVVCAWLAVEESRRAQEQGAAVDVAREELAKHELARQASVNAPREQAAVRAAGPAERLRSFQQVLGDEGQTERYLMTVFRLAGQFDLRLDQGEYQWQADKASAIQRYQMTLPVKGSYRSIRAFCDRMLIALPFASLDEIGFRRDSIGDDEVDASLRFSLFLRNGSAKPEGVSP